MVLICFKIRLPIFYGFNFPGFQINSHEMTRLNLENIFKHSAFAHYKLEGEVFV